MMMFLMLLIFGFIHMAMLATTKQLVNFAAFSAARARMVGNSATAGATSALYYLRWHGSGPPTAPWLLVHEGDQFSQRAAVFFTVPYGWAPVYRQEPYRRGVQLTTSAPFTPLRPCSQTNGQPPCYPEEEGDNRDR
jgi:hypothetical protein